MTIWSETRPTIADPTVKNRRRKRKGSMSIRIEEKRFLIKIIINELMLPRPAGNRQAPIKAELVM